MASSPKASASSGSSTSTSERTPLLRRDTGRPRAVRNVTFNANPVSRTIDPEPPSSLSSSPGSTYTPTPARGTVSAAADSSSAAAPPMLSALNNRLRRRNSHGSIFTTLPPTILPKLGPQRSSKTAQKLKLLPNPELDEADPDEEGGRDVYSQYTRIKDPTARRDAARLGKADRDRLPRVTAYCTANKYQMDGLMRFLKGRSKAKGASPKLIDECIYSPYDYDAGKRTERVEPLSTFRDRPVYTQERRHSTGELEAEERPNVYNRAALTDFQAEQRQHGHGLEDPFGTGRDADNNLTYPDESSADIIHPHAAGADFDTEVHTPEIFLFDYGVVVIWGMSLEHEQRFLKDIAKFELEKLDPDDVETECFNFYYTREYQARIYNDFITLRDKGNYMIKLAISHALAQSVKTSLFEELIASTVESCKDIPTQIALAGKISLSRTQINMQIGELFILRINIHLNGSVLDTPELFWVEPHLEPVYQAVRSYLEMDQRVGLLTERLDVIADLLAVLKDQLSHGHGEMLEWIVIVLIAAEIVVAAINIVVDIYAGVD
ncbi:putative sporulation protein rmd1 [Rosellinia necatrix]|uniref:Putative sporulation protein rmd1 n=1 Tax=Rosellinia necatrix TaxID=77044 RepID=A0A1W2TES9_ROSNE|nr:putative sporulation protein rmd1 [Rosellinia necatrix]